MVCGAQGLGIELNEEERELLQSISAMLREEETETDDSSSLAGRLLRYWAAFYEDTWVWGGKSEYLPYCSSMTDFSTRCPVLDRTKGVKSQSRREWPSSSESWRARTNLPRGKVVLRGTGVSGA